jgi:outer membrane protein
MRRLYLYKFTIALVLLAYAVVPAWAQQPSLTLQQAVAAALEKNPERKMAAADLASANANYRLTRTHLLPQLGFSEGVTRGNDPVFVFGTKLRQQRFTQTDFALNALNRPTPVNNFATRFAGQWTAFDSWKTPFQMKQSSLLQQGATQSMGRTDQELIFRVITAYESVLMSKREVEVAQQALNTAQSVLELSRSRVEAGTVVESDALSAEVNLATRKAELIRAQGRESVAGVELGNAMGVSLPAGQATVEELHSIVYSTDALDAEVTVAQKNRPDLKALDLQQQAQQAGLKAAKSSFGPRVDTFGSWEMDKQSFAGTGGNNWIAGAELRIDIFPVEKREQLAIEKAGLQRIQAGQTSAQNTVRLEVSRAYYQHLAAEQTLAVTKASMTQADESLRIIHNRYEAGLATVTDVLRAEDAARQTQTSYWQAVYDNTITFAALRLATGTLNADQVVNFQ